MNKRPLHVIIVDHHACGYFDRRTVYFISLQIWVIRTFLFTRRLTGDVLLGDIILVQEKIYENIDLGPADGRAFTGFLCSTNPSNHPNPYSGAAYSDYRAGGHICTNASWLNFNLCGRYDPGGRSQ
jgi:hypothetical protein